MLNVITLNYTSNKQKEKMGFDYTPSMNFFQVPAPLTEEMEEERKSKEAERKKAQRKARKERLKVRFVSSLLFVSEFDTT